MMDAERLRELFDYDPETGVFRNRVYRGGRCRVGDVTGTVIPGGYKNIRIARKTYRAARLAWLWMTGEWPEHEIDHIDRDPGNNRWSNLRQATRSQNVQNKRVNKNNAAGLKGVFLDKRRGHWFSSIMLDGKVTNLGRFPTPEEAHAAYMQAAARLFGQFAYRP